MHRAWRIELLLTLASFAVLIHSTGCGAVPDLPDPSEVNTSATNRITAAKGTGPAVFAGGTWSLTRIPDPADTEPPPTPPPGPYGGVLSGVGLKRPPVGSRIFLVEFDENGVMTRITENQYFLAQFYGSEVPVGGGWWGTTLPGVTFTSAAYGGEADGRFGLATIVHVRFGSLLLGRAVLYAWGTVTGDLVEGRFGYLLDFTDGIVAVLGTTADEYPIEGQRVPRSSPS